MTDNMFTVPEDMRRVVLCKDCEYYKPMRNNPAKSYCADLMGLLGASPDDYCSYGKRRENGK